MSFHGDEEFIGMNDLMHNECTNKYSDDIYMSKEEFDAQSEFVEIVSNEKED